jgi:predicted metal-dependent HD superfamily phosphohydrolase
VVNLSKLARSWQQCWPDLAGSIDPSVQRSKQQEIERVFQLLVAAYTQPDRHYHNLHHIDHLLTVLSRFIAPARDLTLPALQDPISVSLAVWFHDFIYDSQASDNELQSAKAATELFTNIGRIDAALTPQLQSRIDRVAQLILATRGHQIDPDDPDLGIFLDADLAILGTDPATYRDYARSIRREYSWVSDTDYRTGRSRVLASFLNRDRLYCTDLFFTELESIARLNLESELAALGLIDN